MKKEKIATGQTGMFSRWVQRLDFCLRLPERRFNKLISELSKASNKKKTKKPNHKKNNIFFKLG